MCFTPWMSCTMMTTAQSQKAHLSFYCVTVSGRHSQPCLYLQKWSYKTQVSKQEKSLGYVHHPINVHRQSSCPQSKTSPLGSELESPLPTFIYPIGSILCQLIYGVTARYGQELLRNRTSGTAAKPLFWRRSLVVEDREPNLKELLGRFKHVIKQWLSKQCYTISTSFNVLVAKIPHTYLAAPAEKNRQGRCCYRYVMPEMQQDY